METQTRLSKYVVSISFSGNEKSARNVSDRSFFVDGHAACPCQTASFFPGFGGLDRSFWPEARRDVRPKTSSLGCFLVSEDFHEGTAVRRGVQEAPESCLYQTGGRVSATR